MKQGEGVSLEAQTDAIQAFADQHDLTIINWYEETETAAKTGRPVFTQLVKDLQEGKAAGLIMHKIDRSARNLKDWAIVGDLQDSGIAVHFAAESVDFASRGGRLTADIQAVIAADYIRNLRQETLKGLNGRLSQGIYPFKAPLGYVDNGKGKVKTIDPVKGPLVRHLFDCYAAGTHSCQDLVEEAAKLGLKSFRGGRVTKTCIEKMLANPFYTGLMYLPSRNQTYQGAHKPLIGARQFKKIQDIKACKAVRKSRAYPFSFRRLFKCKHCATAYIAEKQKGHSYYRCHTKGCSASTIREERIERIVVRQLRRLVVNEDMYERFFNKLRTEAEGASKLQQAINLESQKLGQRKARLLEAYLDQLIDKAEYEDQQQALLLAEAELAERARKQRGIAHIEAHIREIVELFKNIAGLYEMADQSEKPELIKTLFSNRRIDGKNVELEPRNWVLGLQNQQSDLFGTLVRGTDRTAVCGGTTKPPGPMALDALLADPHLESFATWAKAITKERNSSSGSG